MNSSRLLWLLFTMALLGGIMGYWLSIEHSAPEVSAAREIKTEVGLDEAEAQVSPMLPAVESQLDMSFPEGAIEGELVVHFTDYNDYLAYLKALAEVGMQPIGQIDKLLAVRIPQEALLKLKLGRYGARASYSHRIERPLPPVEIAPEALARLVAFGDSARYITGGAVEGLGEGVLVAILDSGIEAHPQFDDVSIARLDLTGAGVSASGAGHGTSVASIIAGAEGVAPNSELFVVRVLDDQGMGNSYHVAEGIVQAVDKGAQIINLSLGAYQDSPLLRQAVSYAHEQGVLLVAAAGNDGYTRMPYPAAYDEVLAVTAVDAKNQQALFPNQSEQIDFAAPGVGVLTAKEDEGTHFFSGTSAAAPFVTGTLASLLSGESPLPPAEAVALLKRTLNDEGAPGSDPVYGAGVIDWDRLRERDMPNVLDAALAGIHLQPDALPGTTMPIEVTVQNRGTAWLNKAQLEISIGEAEPMSFTLGALEPGQITTRKVFTQIPALGSEETLRLAARVIPEEIIDDVRLENNIKSVAYRPAN